MVSLVMVLIVAVGLHFLTVVLVAYLAYFVGTTNLEPIRLAKTSVAVVRFG